MSAVGKAVAAAAGAAGPVERRARAVGAALGASGLFHLGVFFVDGGPWDGPVSWRKPFTFGMSSGLTLIAAARVTSYVRISARVRTVLLVLFGADCVLGVAGITLQAWHGIPSHFDMETPADTAVAMSLALRAGFALLAVGLLSGAEMIVGGVVDTRTGHQQAAYHWTGMPKPLHGVVLHAVLVLPAPAWAVSRMDRPAARQRRAVLVEVGVYGAAAVGALGSGALSA